MSRQRLRLRLSSSLSRSSRTTSSFSALSDTAKTTRAAQALNQLDETAVPNARRIIVAVFALQELCEAIMRSVSDGCLAAIARPRLLGGLTQVTRDGS